MSALLFIVASDSSSTPVAVLRRILRNSLVSSNSKRAYGKAFDDFLRILEQSESPLCRAVFMEYRAVSVPRP